MTKAVVNMGTVRGKRPVEDSTSVSATSEEPVMTAVNAADPMTSTNLIP